jgi:tetraacyldisaccharide 4'-kinase
MVTMTDDRLSVSRIMVRVWKGQAPILRGLLFVPLCALSALYGSALIIREFFYRSGIAKVERARIPVISVGNITLGGTGKTTVVEKLSRELKRRGFSPGIVLRGYRKKKKGVFAVDPGSDDAESAGDEAAMLSRRTLLPVIVGKKRAECIEKGMRQFGIDIAIFDDGYQVRDVHKDVEVLMVSGQGSEPAARLFPLGPYREPLGALKKADMLLVTKGPLTGEVKAVAAGMPTFHVRYRPLHLFNMRRRAMAHYRFIEGKSVVAFSGLGDNSSFFGLLRDIGANIVRTIEFRDHHIYDTEDVRRLASLSDADMLVTTEKDAVKLEQVDVPDNLFYLSIEAEIENEKALVDLMLQKIKQGSGHSGVRR